MIIMQHFILLSLVYVMFFLSGAAALMYQVVWVRSLSLIFGGTHLAVTVVLSIFMAGLALGGYFIGKYVDRSTSPLRLYGLLEIGIALFAVVFVVLIKIYPSLYISLAQGRDDSVIYLTGIRILFAFIALIIPTTLMGGTLPVLSRFLSRQPEKIREHLSLLYGINTLGAVLGAALAGFFLLRLFSVSFTLKAAIIINLIIGIRSIIMQRWQGHLLRTSYDKEPLINQVSDSRATDGAVGTLSSETSPLLPSKLILWGIGISGFCALGYEVLWTRVLSLVAGASVYSFTTMLVAFLSGIALGSKVFGVFPRFFRSKKEKPSSSIAWFGVVQISIGLSALLVSIFMRDLPFHTVRLREFIMQWQTDTFATRQFVNFILAYIYMLVPTFFMGVAFPLAGKIHVQYRQKIGLAVGEILAYNTVGAIFGAAVSGFALIYLFGMERALQILVTINIGYGILVLASLRRSRVLQHAILAGSAAILIFLMLNSTGMRMWDNNYFAIYRNNDPAAFRSPEMFQEALNNTEILYYEEGVEAVISSVKIKGGGIQALLVNSKVVADTHPSGIQCQYTLGHLPMLLHKNPEKVLVIGLGTGMTLGATSVHPGVKEVVLAEIEPKVMGGARTFADYNHRVLDNPKLKVVFNDGRNFLMTTREKFDVITADPIHPWAQGASYLYTDEYFTIAADHLLPGGIMCQWLPVYELSTADLQAVVKTFSQSFKYTMLWLTHHDAELIGSNESIIIDEAELDRRIAATPAIAGDLQEVQMASAADFMSYFVMGSKGLADFGRGGVINTDDNLYLEFSSPMSIARAVMTDNLNTFHRHLESIFPYLNQPEDSEQRLALQGKWELYYKAARVAIKGQALMTGQLFNTPEFSFLMQVLETKYPFFARGKFLHNEYQYEVARIPRLLDKETFAFLDHLGRPKTVEISAVIAPISRTRANLLLLNNAERIIYGQQLITGANIKEQAHTIARERLAVLRKIYRERVRQVANQGDQLPRFDQTMEQLKAAIAVSMPTT